MHMFMDWSEKERELYDFSYLEDLPEVFKSGFMSKKARQEAATLASCLEAFLKEHPLGPDDMWYCPECKAHRQARLVDVTRDFSNSFEAVFLQLIHEEQALYTC